MSCSITVGLFGLAVLPVDEDILPTVLVELPARERSVAEDVPEFKVEGVVVEPCGFEDCGPVLVPELLGLSCDGLVRSITQWMGMVLRAVIKDKKKQMSIACQRMGTI